MKNEGLNRFIKIMLGEKGINGCRLNSLIQSGNTKIPRTTGIFNMGSATDCPSLKLGLCQAVNKNGKNICYAIKSEKDYRPGVLPYRRKQEKYWKSVTAEEFIVDFLTLNSIKTCPYKALRLNESGDFWSQECVNKAEYIARVLKKYGVKVYCYTARKDLDYSNVRDLIISGSGFYKKGLKGVFKIIDNKEEKPKGYGICKMSCKDCRRCLDGRKTAVLSH